MAESTAAQDNISAQLIQFNPLQDHVHHNTKILQNRTATAFQDHHQHKTEQKHSFQDHLHHQNQFTRVLQDHHNHILPISIQPLQDHLQ